MGARCAYHVTRGIPRVLLQSECALLFLSEPRQPSAAHRRAGRSSMLRSVDETCRMPVVAAEKRKLPLPASSAPPSEKQPRRSPAADDAPQPLDMRRVRPSVIRRCASAAQPHGVGELPPRPAGWPHFLLTASPAHPQFVNRLFSGGTWALCTNHPLQCTSSVFCSHHLANSIQWLQDCQVVARWAYHFKGSTHVQCM
ncbi:hypothetical protein V5799_024742 [Amblyomma americanum]|uniref:Uncharacterized protein n=1 Tax=Amblyomma americanum TaxID=6943 RepID=A0AAQ4EBF9_AMBAM